jgi:hypothetical protein
MGAKGKLKGRPVQLIRKITIDGEGDILSSSSPSPMFLRGERSQTLDIEFEQGQTSKPGFGRMLHHLFEFVDPNCEVDGESEPAPVSVLINDGLEGVKLFVRAVCPPLVQDVVFFPLLTPSRHSTYQLEPLLRHSLMPSIAVWADVWPNDPGRYPDSKFIEIMQSVLEAYQRCWAVLSDRHPNDLQSGNKAFSIDVRLPYGPSREDVSQRAVYEGEIAAAGAGRMPGRSEIYAHATYIDNWNDENSGVLWEGTVDDIAPVVIDE